MTDARVGQGDVQLPPLEFEARDIEASSQWWDRIKFLKGGSVGAKNWYAACIVRERQLLAALRTIADLQAKLEGK